MLQYPSHMTRKATKTRTVVLRTRALERLANSMPMLCFARWFTTTQRHHNANRKWQLIHLFSLFFIRPIEIRCQFYNRWNDWERDEKSPPKRYGHEVEMAVVISSNNNSIHHVHWFSYVHATWMNGTEQTEKWSEQNKPFALVSYAKHNHFFCRMDNGWICCIQNIGHAIEIVTSREYESPAHGNRTQNQRQTHRQSHLFVYLIAFGGLSCIRRYTNFYTAKVKVSIHGVFDMNIVCNEKKKFYFSICAWDRKTANVRYLKRRFTLSLPSSTKKRWICALSIVQAIHNE